MKMGKKIPDITNIKQGDTEIYTDVISLLLDLMRTEFHTMLSLCAEAEAAFPPSSHTATSGKCRSGER